MRQEYEKLKPFIIEIKRDPHPLVLPSEAYPGDINAMGMSTRPCIHCGQMNEHREYFGGVYNHVVNSIDTVHFSLGFTCSHCGEENHAKDKIVVEYTCSCCGGFTPNEEPNLPEGMVTWFAKTIDTHGCIYFDVEKHYEGKCIADYAASKLSQ